MTNPIAREPDEAMIEAGKRAWHDWENGIPQQHTLGECVQCIYLAMEAARAPTKGRETALPASELIDRIKQMKADRHYMGGDSDGVDVLLDDLWAFLEKPALASPTPRDTLEDEEVAVERVAIALCIANNKSAGQFKAYDFARAAIAALNSTQQATRESDREALLNDIGVMMSEFVDNWPNPKRVETALALIAKTFREALNGK
jgi:hypothetical protein